MMRKLLLFGIILLIFNSCGTATNLFPKKYFGQYEGTQPSYEVQLGNKNIAIKAEKITLTLGNKILFIHFSSKTEKGTYTLKAETKMYYSLDVALENGTIEHWELWKKGKRLIRNPTHPIPSTIFLKK